MVLAQGEPKIGEHSLISGSLCAMKLCCLNAFKRPQCMWSPTLGNYSLISGSICVGMFKGHACIWATYGYGDPEIRELFPNLRLLC